MKNYIIYFLVIGSLIFESCSDSFLDSEPLTDLTEASFYKTKRDAELAIVGCYDGMQRLYISGGIGLPLASEVLSDNCFGGSGQGDGLGMQLMDEFDLSRSPGDINMLDDNWIAYYAAIFRTNALIEKIDQIDWEGDSLYKRSIEAQARFLRAYSYFDMVRLWESVPLLTKPQSGNIPQSSADEIYALIAEDLLFATENASETVEAGRVNKWVAKAYLARVYLYYTGYYGTSDLVGLVSESQTLEGLEEVIASGSYGLIPDFKDLWPGASSFVNEAGDGLETTYAGKDNVETVFSVKYNITSDYDGNGDGNHWLVFLGFRAQSFSPYGGGWGFWPVNPNLWNAYDDQDTRKTASIISMADESLDFDPSDTREYTGYANKKYVPLANPDGTSLAEVNGGTNFQLGNYQDYVVMRYADVLLMAAELGSPSAQTYYDLVRTRAGLASRSATTANIMDERKLEFAFEGLRYWDLLRQGVDVAAATISEVTTVQNGGNEVSKTIVESNIIDKRGLQMIPQNQITRSNGLLKQNTGWE